MGSVTSKMYRQAAKKLLQHIKEVMFPYIDRNIRANEASHLKKHIEYEISKNNYENKSEGFIFPFESGVAIGEYANRVNLFLRVTSLFKVSLQAKFKIEIQKGNPDYLKAVLDFQTKSGNEWKTAIACELKVRYS